MVEKFKDYEKLFNEINKLAKIKLNLYVIGGAVLLYRDLKPATKDIDIVLKTKEEYQELNAILKKINFKPVAKIEGYENLNISNMLKKNDLQVDIFFEKVCSKFSFSENMVKRSEKVLLLDNLEIYLCSNEDVFVFKTMTEREGDIDDCISLAKRGLNWQSILDEIKYQAKGKDVWITWINERLELLEEKGVVVPIADETRKLTIAYYEELEKRIG